MGADQYQDFALKQRTTYFNIGTFEHESEYLSRLFKITFQRQNCSPGAVNAEHRAAYVNWAQAHSHQTTQPSLGLFFQRNPVLKFKWRMEEKWCRDVQVSVLTPNNFVQRDNDGRWKSNDGMDDICHIGLTQLGTVEGNLTAI